MAKARLILGWTLVGIVALWFLLNLRSADVHILIGTVSMPIAFVILFSAALGAGAVFAFQFMKKFRKDPDGP